MNAEELDEIRRLFRSHAEPLAPEPVDVSPSVSPVPGIRAVIFDVYGTLFISGSGDIGVAKDTADHELFYRALAEAGVDVRDRSAGRRARKA